MQIQMMKLSEIHPYEKNPRFNDGAVEAVANSIKCRGQGFRRGCRAHPPESGGTARSHGSSGGDRGKTTLLSLNGVLWKNLLGIF